jgi:hypothetical protein
MADPKVATPPEAPKPVLLRFNVTWGVYASRDVAAFPPERADVLIRQGIARLATADEIAQGRAPDAPEAGTVALEPTAGQVLVEFTRGHQGYNMGEIAGFSEQMADRLIRGGVAIKAKPKAVKAAAQAAAAKANPQRIGMRLLKPVPPCNVGETIFVYREQAELYREKGIAEPVDPKLLPPMTAAAPAEDEETATAGAR